MGHQNEPPCIYIHGLTPKGTEGKNLMEVEDVGLWVLLRQRVGANCVQDKETGGVISLSVGV